MLFIHFKLMSFHSLPLSRSRMFMALTLKILNMLYNSHYVFTMKDKGNELCISRRFVVKIVGKFDHKS